jgi:hypothetical protein
MSSWSRWHTFDGGRGTGRAGFECPLGVSRQRLEDRVLGSYEAWVNKQLVLEAETTTDERDMAEAS